MTGSCLFSVGNCMWHFFRGTFDVHPNLAKRPCSPCILNLECVSNPPRNVKTMQGWNLPIWKTLDWRNVRQSCLQGNWIHEWMADLETVQWVVENQLLQIYHCRIVIFVLNGFVVLETILVALSRIHNFQEHSRLYFCGVGWCFLEEGNVVFHVSSIWEGWRFWNRRIAKRWMRQKFYW